MTENPFWDKDLETAPWHEVEAWQSRRVADFIDGIRSRSAFYKERLGSSARPRAGAADLALLEDYPFTTKDELRHSQEEAGGEFAPPRSPGRDQDEASAPPSARRSPLGTIQAAPTADIVQTVSSSGTTGHPVYYGLTASDLAAWRDGIACVFYTCGIRRTDVVGHLVSLPGVAGGLPYADGFRHLGATLAWLGGFPTERILSSVQRLGVTAVLGTSSFGTYLTDHCEQITGRPARDLGVRKLLGGGEPGLGNPEIRAKIRDGWGLTHLRDMMGLGDVMAALWAECDAEAGMHFCGQRHVAVELVDPQSGKHIPWEDGAEGEAVYTTFDREATPVLRFRSADHVLVTGTRCSCGRTSPRIRCIGRTDDMLIYKAMNVFPGAIRDVALAAAGGRLQPYLRVWKDTPTQVRFDDPIGVEIEASAGVDAAAYAEVARQVETQVRNRLQVRVAVTVVAPDTLPRSAYKTPLVAVRGRDD